MRCVCGHMKFRVLRNNEPDSFNGNITACRIGFQVGKYRAWLTFDSKIASGQVVRSLNGLKDEVTMEGVGSASVRTSGNRILISTSREKNSRSNQIFSVRRRRVGALP